MIMEYEDYEGKNYWLLSKKRCMAYAIKRKITFPIHVVWALRPPSQQDQPSQYVKSASLIGLLDYDRVMALVSNNGQVPCPGPECKCARAMRELHKQGDG